MNIILIYGICIFILIFSGASYVILKNYGYKKTGIVVSIFFALIVLIPVFLFTFESQFYFKSDAKNDLKLADIVLNDDFEIESNDISGLTDYYQTTMLKISDKDRNIIIDKIKNHKNFEILDPEEFQGKNISYENGKSIQNYQIKDEYILETYKKREGYSGIQIMIYAKKKSNILSLSRIED